MTLLCLFQNGIAACLMFIDFFSVVAQRSALMVTANCVQNMTLEEFQSMRESLPVLSGRLSHSVSVCVLGGGGAVCAQWTTQPLSEWGRGGCLCSVDELATDLFTCTIWAYELCCVCQG